MNKFISGARGLLGRVMSAIEEHNERKVAQKFFDNRWGDLQTILLYQGGLISEKRMGEVSPELLDPKHGLKKGYAGFIQVAQAMDREGNPVKIELGKSGVYRHHDTSLFLIGYKDEGFNKLHGVVSTPEREEGIGCATSVDEVMGLVHLWQSANIHDRDATRIDPGFMQTMFMPASGSKPRSSTGHPDKSSRKKRPFLVSGHAARDSSNDTTWQKTEQHHSM